jgi:chaperone modulatory protein CbpM
MKNSLEIMKGTLVDDDKLLTLADLCRACGVHAEVITDMIEYGIIEPSGDTAGHWQFTGGCLWRVTTVVRLQHDLEVNLAGAALALDLIEEVRELRRQLKAGQQDKHNL